MKGKDRNKKCKGAILVVDMIEAFYRGSLPNPRVTRIIEPIKELIRRKIREGYKVIFLGDRHELGDPEFQLFGEHAVTAEDRKVIRELQEFLNGSIFIGKTKHSGFAGTDLKKVLAGIEPQEVIVVGVCTDICVYFTSYDLWRLGYKIIVPRDTVETYDAPGHNADEMNQVFLAKMRNELGATIVERQEEL